MGKALLGFILGVAVLFVAIIYSRPKVEPPPPAVVTYDVTMFIPGVGPQTTLLRSDGFTFRDGCVISQSPEPKILCNVIMVNVCTEDCVPKAPARPTAPEATEPSRLDTNSLVARS